MGKFRRKKLSKLSVFSENWHIWYLERMLILIPKFFFRISNSKFLFGQIWAKKVKTWKLAPVVSRGCWFLLQYLFSEFQTRNRFLGRSAPKKSNLFILPENWHTWYLEDTYSYSEISFLNFKTEIHFWAELVPGSEIVCFFWCSYIKYLEGDDLFLLKSVTGEDNKGGL